MTDPYATDKIKTCTSKAELTALLVGWKSRGVDLSAAQLRLVGEMDDRFLRLGDR